MKNISDSNILKTIKSILPGGKKREIPDLFKNMSVPLLILNPVWVQYQKTARTDRIVKLEERVKDLLKRSSRVYDEYQNLTKKKKECLDKIMQLTPEAHEQYNEVAKATMEKLSAAVTEINTRLEDLTKASDAVPEELDRANTELLKETVEACYESMRENRGKLEEITPQVDTYRKQFREAMDTKMKLEDDIHDAYTLLHHLIGKDMIEQFDEVYGDKG